MKSQFHKIDFRNVLINSFLAVCSTPVLRQAADPIFEGKRSFIGDFQGLDLKFFPDQVCP